MREVPEKQDLTGNYSAKFNSSPLTRNHSRFAAHLWRKMCRQEQGSRQSSKTKYVVSETDFPGACEMLGDRSRVKDLTNPACQKLDANPIEFFAQAECLKTD